MGWTRRGFLSTCVSVPAAAALVGLSNGRSDAASVKPGVSDRPRLAFRDGRFKILQLTDLHLAFDEERTAKAFATLDVVRRLVSAEKPDLTILTGDLITADSVSLSGALAEAWAILAEPFAEAQLPFAVTFGNHDHERKESAAEQLAMIQASAWNVTFSEDESLPGAGNCSLPIYGSDGKPKRRIWLFDSHSYPAQSGISDYDWIKNEQIQWYRKTSERIEQENGVLIPGLAFFHIPLPEYWKVHHAEGTLGTGNEDVCAPELNSGLFTAFFERGDIEGVFVGHDHSNDYIASYKRIALGYGRKTGTDSYGEHAHGGRIIELEENGAGFKTYITTGDERLLDYTFSPPPKPEAQSE